MPQLPDLPQPSSPPAPFSPEGRRALPHGLPSVPERLHPLSSVVYLARAAFAFVYVAVSTAIQPGGGGTIFDVVVLGLGVASGVVSWWVTTWSVEGSILQVSTGLIRRKVVRVPLARAQAVDIVEPWIARLVGLAEIRVRTGGGGAGEARLQYLRVADAQAVRSSLIALAHGLPHTTPEAVERPLVKVDNGMLVGSSLLTGRILSAAAVVLVDVLLALSHRPVAAQSVLLYAIVIASTLGRRVANEWGLTIAEAPDGMRLSTGVGSRLRETIPINRLQAIHKLEPLFWRLLGWQRLELHLAGGVARRHRQTTAVVRRALLPVGRSTEAEALLTRLLGKHAVPMRRPPRRGFVRSPFSFHFLAAGYDETLAMSVSGRVTRRTELVALAKVQSIHYVEGPLLRLLGLATVRVHAAGRGATVSWRQWDAEEARELVDDLTRACAAARAASSTAAGVIEAPPPQLTDRLVGQPSPDAVAPTSLAPPSGSGL